MGMSDLRGHLSDLRAAQDRRRDKRIEANATADVSSLVELAKLRHRQSEEAKAKDLAAKRDRREALRSEYFRRITDRALAELPALLAQEWDLPDGHAFIQDLRWELVTDCFESATFAQEPSGAISVEVDHGNRLEEVFETVIDGRRVRAQFSRPTSDLPSTVHMQGVTKYGSRGLRGLADLGEFLSDPDTKIESSTE